MSLATQAAVPLKSVLKQMLKPLGLTYKIEDEMVLITSPQAAVATGQAIRKTYYIGDLIKQGQFMRVPTGDGLTNLVAIGPKADVGPVISLIETTIAPGTWMVPDPGGGMVRTKVKSRRPVSADEMGSIIPFYLSVSLIIECTEDVHEDLANFFRGLRDLIYSRDGVDAQANGQRGPESSPKAGSDGEREAKIAPRPDADGTADADVDVMVSESTRCWPPGVNHIQDPRSELRWQGRHQAPSHRPTLTQP